MPPGICEDGTSACRLYKDDMCPTKGRAEGVYETYAYCCCRKFCGLCNKKSLEQRVKNRFEKAEDRSSYDWSGQRWHFGRDWRNMDSFSGEWGNPFDD